MSEMNNAVNAFRKICPLNFDIKPSSRPQYTQIKVAGWPASVHYEFRFHQQEGMFVECHIEAEKFEYLGRTFSKIANDYPEIKGNTLQYLHQATNKKRPSLRIELGFGIGGETAAQIMLEFIQCSEEKISHALGKGTSGGTSTISKRPDAGEYRPTKVDVEQAINQISPDAEGGIKIDVILDQVEKNVIVDGKKLKSNWREITEMNVAVWFK